MTNELAAIPPEFGDVLLYVYTVGWLDGSGQIVPRSADALRAALIDSLRERHRIEYERVCDALDVDQGRRNVPAWLLKKQAGRP